MILCDVFFVLSSFSDFVISSHFSPSRCILRSWKSCALFGDVCVFLFWSFFFLLHLLPMWFPGETKRTTVDWPHGLAAFSLDPALPLLFSELGFYAHHALLRNDWVFFKF